MERNFPVADNISSQLKMETNLKITNESPLTLQLEELLSFPYLWHPSRTVSFLKAAHNSIKGKEKKGNPPENATENEKDEEDKIAAFKKILDSNPERVFPETGGDWKLALGQEHFAILTTRTKKGINTKSTSDFLGALRNKCEHADEFTREEREKLGWFPDNTKRDIDDALFVTYLNNRIPRLVSYLWIQFERFKDSPALKEYYPLPLNFSDLPLDFLHFAHQLKFALQLHLEKGHLEARFSTKHPASSSKTIEFRALGMDALQRTLAGNKVVGMSISDNKTSFFWEATNGIRKSIYLEWPMEDVELKNVTIIISSVGLDSWESMHQVVCSSNEDDRSRVIFFTERVHVQDRATLQPVVSKISELLQVILVENGLKWKELSLSLQENLEREGKIKFQNKLVSVADALPSRPIILDELEGSAINELLQTGQLEILKDCCIPKGSELYLPRRLYSRARVNANVFCHNFPNDVFIIINPDMSEISGLFSPSDTSVKYLEYIDHCSLPMWNRSNYKVIVVKTHLSPAEINQVSTKHTRGFGDYNKRVHFVHHLTGDSFEWVSSQGSFSNVQLAFAESAREVGTMAESELIDHLGKAEKNASESIVFIADKPGMGKTQVLLSLAERLAERERTFVLFLNFDAFVKHLVKHSSLGKLAANHIISAICEIGHCNAFEQALVENWLRHGNVKLELLIDGLDEISGRATAMAVHALRIIKTELPMVRVWVTLRDHMLEALRKRFYCLGYAFEPFSEQEQIDYLVRHWTAYCKVQSNSAGAMVSAEELRQFAMQCINIPLYSEETGIAGVPLQVRMIAEIYERKVLEGDLNLLPNVGNTLVNLYEQLKERKLEIYAREKKGIPSRIGLKDTIFNTVRNEIEISHVYYAISLLFGEIVAKEFQSIFTFISHNQRHLEQAVLEQGIIQTLSPLTFIHRTIAEFIVAWFISKVLSGSFYGITESDPAFKNFLWNNVLAVTASDDEKAQFKYPTLCHFLNSMWKGKSGVKSSKELNDEYQFMMFSMVATGIRSAGEVSLKSKTDFLERAGILSACKEKDFRNIMSLLATSEQHVLRLFSLALEHQHYDFCCYLIEQNPATHPTNWHKLQSCYDRRKYGVLHWLVVGLCGEKLCSPEFWEEKVARLKEFLKYLVVKDVSILEQKDFEGRTPLLLLLGSDNFNGDFSVIKEIGKFLVSELGADVNARDDNGNGVLHNSHKCILRKDDEKGERLYRACRHECLLDIYLPLWEFFMQNGCIPDTINYVNYLGYTPLMSVVDTFSDHPKTFCALSFFQKYGADFNAVNQDGLNALHIARQKEMNTTFIAELLKCGEESAVDVALPEAIERNVSEPDREKVNENHVVPSTITECSAVTNPILAEKVAPVAKPPCDSDVKMFIMALKLHHFDFCIHVLETCAEFLPLHWHRFNEYDDTNRYGIIHWVVEAIFASHETASLSLNQVKRFLKYVVEINKAVVEIRDAQGRTPLLLLVTKIKGDKDHDLLVLDMIRYFVKELGTDVNSKDDNNNAVLHLNLSLPASEIESYEQKSSLLSLYVELWDLFVKSGCSKDTINCVNSDGDSPFFNALEFFGDLLQPALSQFQQSGVDFEVKDKIGNTPLHFVIISYFKIEFIRELLNCGADINAVNRVGDTALHLAVLQGNLELVNLLVG